LANLQAEVEALTEEVGHIKQGVAAEWQREGQRIKKKGMLETALSAHLEAVRRELDAEIQQTKRKEEAVERQCEQTKRALVAHRLMIPRGFV
jgi:hypothetical protein